jgi:hypothetical protein
MVVELLGSSHAQPTISGIERTVGAPDLYRYALSLGTKDRDVLNVLRLLDHSMQVVSLALRVF